MVCSDANFYVMLRDLRTRRRTVYDMRAAMRAPYDHMHTLKSPPEEQSSDCCGPSSSLRLGCTGPAVCDERNDRCCVKHSARIVPECAQSVCSSVRARRSNMCTR